MQNFIKTIINAVQSWTKKEIKNSTADWNQNDPSTVDYVKNRTHWSDGLVEEVVLKQQTVGLSDTVDCEIIVGQTYEVTWDNKVYHCVAWGNSSVIGLGFGEFMDIGEGETVPFLIYNNKIRCEHGTTHTISITTTVENIHKLDSKYLDLPTNLATTDDVQEAVDLANTAQTAADNAQTAATNAQNTANTKMDATNPVGTGSFSMNRKSGSIIGQNSVSMGENTIMSLNNGFASGKYNNEPYVENVTSISSNSIYNYFSQDGRAYFYSSEYTFSSETGMYSLVNAIETTGTAMRNNHIDIKNMYFIEKAPESTTMRYVKNIVYRESYAYGIIDGDLYTSDKKSYAHIVGNGTSDTARSNAHTLDWNGVGWFQGGLQVGGTAQDGEGVGYVPAVPAGAQVGQILSVKSVDENGKPTEWEAVDMVGGESVELDTTLSIEGRAADAKAVGDVISNIDIPTSLPANGGNADTLDGKHADEFAAASDIKELSANLANKVSSISVSGNQIRYHIENQGDISTATLMNATTSDSGFMSPDDKIKLNGIEEGANAYTLTAATSSALGGVKIGSNITNSNGTISLTSTNVTTALGYTPVTQNYVTEQIQAAIQASWEASY